MLAKGNILKYEKVLNTNVYEMHTYLAHKFDKRKLKADLRKGKNVTRL